MMILIIMMLFIMMIMMVEIILVFETMTKMSITMLTIVMIMMTLIPTANEDEAVASPDVFSKKQKADQISSHWHQKVPGCE